MVEIVQKDNKVLRQKAKEVKVSEISSPDIQKVLKDMSEAVDGQYDGVAIAAPQIGVSLRIFCISGKAFDADFLEGRTQTHDSKKYPNLFFINPKITKISKDKKLVEEGCLSVRPLFGKVRRASRASVSAYDEKGKKFEMDGTGLLAHIFQHEIDHFEGTLFIDKAKDIREVNY